MRAEDDDIDPKQIDWAQKDAFRKDFSRHANIAFLVQAFGIGTIAFLVPIVLPLVGGYDGHYSISYFYHVPETQNLFVGLLWTVGIFLVLFQGLSKGENLLLSLAGVFLILVAMVPMDAVQCPTGENDAFNWHGAFAIAFFVCLFVVAVFLAKSRLEYILWPPLRRRYKRAYTIAGVAMIGLPVIVYLIHLSSGSDCGHVIYWIEAGAIFAFAFYWFVKTLEYKRLLGLTIKEVFDILRS